MASNESEGDDPILERLRQSASGDAAVRQLRRRYDLLRQDYEQLLDRIGELEDRLSTGQEAPGRAPQTAVLPLVLPGAGPGAGVSAPLTDAVLAPLLKLRDDYVAVVAGINSVVSGLESLAAGALKGQHAAPAPAGPPATPEPRPAAEAPVNHRDEAVAARPRRVQMDVRGHGFGELLDFQERLSRVEGVARVSINAIDAERATLVVELEASGSNATNG
ncbi:MAG: hypothetical protein C0506_01970 [Anaerolinea sp.]|nr:hypothetical protein [Anaerolinea sp.]